MYVVLQMTLALLSPLLASAPAHAEAAGRTSGGADAPLSRCAVQTATVTLVDERLLTRTAITVETVGGYAGPVTVTAGDPRLVRIERLVQGIARDPPSVPGFDVRWLLRLTCRDGSAHVIAGSRIGPDGRTDLSVDGVLASTRLPVRRALERLGLRGVPPAINRAAVPTGR